MLTAVYVGIFVIGFLLLMMNMYHPYTKDSRFYTFTTPIVPQVRGMVVDVPVRDNEPLKQGDVLFKIDSRPYEFELQRLKSEQAAAEQEEKYAKIELDRAIRLAKQKAGPEKDVDKWRAEADRAAANIDRVKAQIADAEFNLSETVVKAPTDGIVTQVQLRPGMMAVPLPLRPVMVFVHNDNTPFIASFPQNCIHSIESGNEAEIAFDSIPGKVFRGKVKAMLPAMAQGQLSPTGSLIDFSIPWRSGRVAFVIDIEDDLSQYSLPAGSAAQTAIYTHHFHPLSLLRKVLLRIRSWENYLFSPLEESHFGGGGGHH
ncbi:MAG: HlyD family secretion protein [Gemmataceae bacterium]|nr:HlyD family secretion protein [Gemmataceae bacterium]